MLDLFTSHLQSCREPMGGHMHLHPKKHELGESGGDEPTSDAAQVEEVAELVFS